MSQPPIPKTVTISAIDRETGEPIQDLVLVLVIIVPRKNDYDCDYKITDAAGHAVYTYQEMALAVETLKKEALMDYASDLEDAFAFEVLVFDSAGIDDLISARALYGIGSPQWKLTPEQEAALQSSANHQYRHARWCAKRYAFQPNLKIRIEVPPLWPTTSGETAE